MQKRAESVSRLWPALVHRCSLNTSAPHVAALVGGAAGPPATTLLPRHCGQEPPFPFPSSRCNPPWITRGHECQSRCPNCPLSPDQDKAFHIRAKKGQLLDIGDCSMVPAAIRGEKSLIFIAWGRTKAWEHEWIFRKRDRRYLKRMKKCIIHIKIYM